MNVVFRMGIKTFKYWSRIEIFMMVILIPYIIDPIFMYCGFSSYISFGRKEEKNAALGNKSYKKCRN